MINRNILKFEREKDYLDLHLSSYQELCDFLYSPDKRLKELILLKSKETDKEFIYIADIVGLDKSLLHFKVEGLKATLEYENPLDTRRTKFSYSFDLPEIADVESIYITYIDGELNIVVPKLARKIKHYTVQ